MVWRKRKVREEMAVMEKLRNKVKAFYTSKTKEKVAITVLALLLVLGGGAFTGYKVFAKTNEAKDKVASVNVMNTKKEQTTHADSKEGISNEEGSSTTDQEQGNVEEASVHTSEAASNGASGTTGHASIPASSTGQGNAGIVPSTSGGHVHNYVPVYQDVPAEGYWQFIPGQVVTETWVVFQDGVEMRCVTDAEKDKIDEYSAYNGISCSEFQKVISQTPSQEVWVETKPAQTVLVGYQCTIDGSWK